MPAILKSGAADRLRRAGRVEGEPQPPPKPPEPDPKVAQMAAQIAELSARLSELGQDQMGAVMALASKSEQNTQELVTAMATLLADRPRQKERWNFTVTERDHTGRIVTLAAEQVE